MQIVVDPNAGFCGGVTKAIRIAGKESLHSDQLYCLGEIVHNQAEVARLEREGLKFIHFEEFKNLKNARVLIRAHGEPPETYKIAKKNHIEIIDATCQVVQRLQVNVKNASAELKQKNGQVVIFGKKNHPEVISLIGQASVEVVVIENKSEINKIDFSKPIHLFSQTTKSIADFEEIKRLIEKRIDKSHPDQDNFFVATNSVCRQVADREGNLIQFAQEHDIVIFVGGSNSSNARFLFGICKSNNSKSYFVTNENEIDKTWFVDANSVGVSGATSTPQWLMNKVADKIKML